MANGSGVYLMQIATNVLAKQSMGCATGGRRDQSVTSEYSLPSSILILHCAPGNYFFAF